MFSVKFITKCNSENLHLIYFKHCRLIKNHKKQMKWSLTKPLEFIKYSQISGIITKTENRVRRFGEYTQ